MQSPILTKYGFRIRTRVGLVVDKLMIHGRDHDEAQRKLRQIYRDCEILECTAHHGGALGSGASAQERVMRLLAG